MSATRKLAWLYAASATFIVVLGYIPGVRDDQGLMFGLFAIDPVDDLVHGLTGLAAALGAWHSTKASLWFFKAFSLFYGLDILAGLFTQRGFLDMTVFFRPLLGPNFGVTNILLNLPHILLVVVALWIIFVLAPRTSER